MRNSIRLLCAALLLCVAAGGAPEEPVPAPKDPTPQLPPLSESVGHSSAGVFGI